MGNDGIITASIIIVTILSIGILCSINRYTMVRVLASRFNTAQLVDKWLFILGTIHHELSHLIVAVLTGAKVTGVKLFSIRNDSDALGYVTFIARGPLVFRLIQRGLVSIAPIVCGCVSIYLLYYYGLQGKQWLDVQALISLFVIISIVHHMSMSKQDLLVGALGIIVVYLILIIICNYVTIDTAFIHGYIKVVLSLILINMLITLTIKIFKRKRYC